MRTNREFYDFVVALPRTGRPLEEYLRALDALAAPHRHRPGVALETFAGMLRDALTSPPAIEPPPDPTEFETMLWHQIADLRGLPLDDPERIYFGVRSEPSGSEWYNAQVPGFLECGAQGAFNGWNAEGEDLIDMPWLDWSDIVQFLYMGQAYE